MAKAAAEARQLRDCASVAMQTAENRVDLLELRCSSLEQENAQIAADLVIARAMVPS